MNNWIRVWYQRSARERGGLALAAGVLIVALGYWLWQPLLAARERLAQRLPRLEQAVAIMRAPLPSSGTQTALATKRPSLDHESLTRRAQSLGLSLLPEANDARSNGRLSFHVPGADFSSLLALLESIRRDTGWQAAELRIAKIGGARVNADVVLVSP